VLGLRQVEKPAALAGRGGCWFEAGGVRLHLGVEAEFRPARRAHPALLVADLDDVARRLAAVGHEVRPDEAIPGHRRFHVYDPFGNRLEFIMASGPAAK
jgi:predicted enzyme related to lactoylglutathione lyase